MTHKTRPSIHPLRDEADGRAPRVSSLGSKQLSQLEKILTSIYPVFSIFLDILTVFDIAALKQTSRTFRDLLVNAQIRDVTFLRDDDPLSRFWIGILGLDRVKEISRLNVDSESMQKGIHVYNRVARVGEALGINLFDGLHERQRKLADCLISLYPGVRVKWQTKSHLWKPISVIGPIPNLRSLCLDGTEIESKFLEMIIYSESFPNLQVLSIVSCRKIELYALVRPGWDREDCDYKGKPNLKELKLWDISEIRYVNTNTTQRDESVAFFEEIETQEVLDILSALARWYILDVDICPQRHILYEPHRGTVISHKMALCCMKCSKTEIVTECYICLLKRSCEICTGYYCANCNPWATEGKKATVSTNKLHDTSVSLQRGDLHLPDVIEYDLYGDGEHQVVKFGCTVRAERHDHNREHYYHRRCSAKLPNIEICIKCNRCLCRWVKSQMMCSECSGFICELCDRFYSSCIGCNRKFCRGHTGSTGTKCMSGRECTSWICAQCTERSQKGEKYLAGAFDHKNKICERCTGVALSQLSAHAGV